MFFVVQADCSWPSATTAPSKAKSQKREMVALPLCNILSPSHALPAFSLSVLLFGHISLSLTGRIKGDFADDAVPMCGTIRRCCNSRGRPQWNGQTYSCCSYLLLLDDISVYGLITWFAVLSLFEIPAQWEGKAGCKCCVCMHACYGYRIRVVGYWASLCFVLFHFL